jgi:outer membrane murein-binding lipoprotein Lpp
MKWKLLRRRMTVSAPRVTIRSQLPWPIRVLLAFVLLVAAAAAGVAIYEYGKEFAGPGRRELTAEIDRLNSQLRELKAERDRLAAVATAYEAQMKVERSAQEQLAAQVAQLETEANRLREDLDFFESLLPAGTGSKGIVIRSFRMQPDGEPNRMRYRLLVQQSGKPQRDFVGSVQMQVNFVQNGRNFTLLVPDPAVPDAARALDLGFRHYQRIEGTLTLPVGAVARSVLVRILAGGETQTQQTFML